MADYALLHALTDPMRAIWGGLACGPTLHRPGVGVFGIPQTDQNPLDDGPILMRLDWRQFLACGEFGCFLLAWVLGIAVAVAEFQGRSSLQAGSHMAASRGTDSAIESLE